MSDNSNSTGSTGSSTNSWTLLSPEEVAIENVGPVDDGTESLGDVPSLAEEVAGAAAEFKPPEIPVETVLSEEGHQVCQETSPESSEGPIPSSPARMSPIPPDPSDLPDLDLESQAPVIHDIVTSSPSDNEHLCAMPFVTNIDLRPSLDIPPVEDPPLEPEESGAAPPLTETSPEELVLDTPDDTVPTRTSPPEESLHVFSVEPDLKILAETLTAADTAADAEGDISPAPEITEPPSGVTESPATEPADESTAHQTAGSSEPEEPVEEEEEEEQEEQQASVEAELAEPPETVTQDESEHKEEPSGSFEFGDPSGFEDGLRRRTVPPFEAARPRTSDEEDDEEEVEFKLAEKKEEKPWFSLNKCIVGALVLLFLGSLFLSGDFDASDLSDGEQSQDWLSGDPQDMKELLDRLTQENQQITQLEAQLQSQKEELDSALKAVAASGDEQGKADLEKENSKLKEELSSLPELKTELESLRARVTELSQLKAEQEILPASSPSATPPDGKEAESNQKAAGPQRREDSSDGGALKEELRRQKGLLEESKKRLQMMKKDGGQRKQVRDHLEQIQRKLSEQVERWEKKKPQEHKWKEGKGKNNGKDHWKKEEKKEWRGEKEWKHGKDGGRRDKEQKKEWKSDKQNSHKEAWRKHQDEWDRKKDQRRSDREERRKEKPWHSRKDKNSHGDHHHHHHQHQHHHQPHQHHQQHHHQQPRQSHRHHHDFWRDQEQKLQRNVRPQLGCSSVEGCAAREGLYPVELPEFEELLEGYLSKLEGSSPESKDRIARLTADFFEGGVFIHDRVLFADFAEDVADILEDMVDLSEDNDSLEEEMEEFEREALWKFAATA
ncbi:pre-B-cell leukemia transcription factor-interacting protein 1 [Salarias fasciatus]|uniref:pre-B-cell leukemia transcription factor-interacting protein 1 n=1 Tax=Salarias fasciatus TaxID=181472 RepID=UPI0011767953|nr:pre-B-cell leukemia transcription factor-interacting protein 1-like [Salarias fasciatus]